MKIPSILTKRFAIDEAIERLNRLADDEINDSHICLVARD
jgi:hypothetical protein